MSQAGFISQAGFGASQAMGGMERQDNLLPVTAAMIKSAEESDGKLVYDGQPLASILYVGQIVDVTNNTTNIKYTVSDCSGSVTVTKWIESGEEVAPLDKDTYIKVMGKPQLFNGQPQINAYHFRACSSYDEVTHHYIKVIYAKMKAAKMGSAPSVAGEAAKTAATSSNFGMGMSNEGETEFETPEQKELYNLIAKSEGSHENGVN